MQAPRLTPEAVDVFLESIYDAAFRSVNGSPITKGDLDILLGAPAVVRLLVPFDGKTISGRDFSFVLNRAANVFLGGPCAFTIARGADIFEVDTAWRRKWRILGPPTVTVTVCRDCNGPGSTAYITIHKDLDYLNGRNHVDSV